MKKRFFYILSMLFLSACQSSTITQQDRVVIDGKQIVIKYLNFTPKKVDINCLKKGTKKLFLAIKNGKTNRFLSIFFINHEHFKRVSSKKSLIFENEDKNIFILYSIKQKIFFLSSKAFDKDNSEPFSMNSLVNEIDFDKCF